MKLVQVSDIFTVEYGNSLELNKLTKKTDGINFISRTAKNNGVSAKVERIKSIKPSSSGIITVSLGGSVLETFLQTKPFYTGYHIFCLKDKVDLSIEEKLYYCSCISANRYRYNYGRQANRTLKDLLIPDLSEIPEWINNVDLNQFDNANESFLSKPTPKINLLDWTPFRIDELFELKKGKRLTKANMTSGEVPFIGAIDKDNGYRQFIGQEPIHKGNTISVNYNGSVAEAFFQPKPFWASDDVNVLYPKFTINQYIGLFIASLIKLEKYRFNYGRKWHLERMGSSVIYLPTKKDKKPDYKFMEIYIKTLDYSKQV
jgi:hypothetical protein